MKIFSTLWVGKTCSTYAPAPARELAIDHPRPLAPVIACACLLAAVPLLSSCRSSSSVSSSRQVATLKSDTLNEGLGIAFRVLRSRSVAVDSLIVQRGDADLMTTVGEAGTPSGSAVVKVYGYREAWQEADILQTKKSRSQSTNESEVAQLTAEDAKLQGRGISARPEGSADKYGTNAGGKFTRVRTFFNNLKHFGTFFSLRLGLVLLVVIAAASVICPGCPWLSRVAVKSAQMAAKIIKAAAKFSKAVRSSSASSSRGEKRKKETQE